MSGSKIALKHMQRVRLALRRHGFPSQNALAVSLGLSRATITSFFNGKRIAHINFVEISERLGLDWNEIVYKEELDNPELDNQQPDILNTTEELTQIRIRMLLAKSSRELLLVLYEIDEFLTRFPNDSEARLLKNIVKKTTVSEPPKVPEQPYCLDREYKAVGKPRRLRPGLRFILIPLVAVSLVYLLYFFVRLILEILK